MQSAAALVQEGHELDDTSLEQIHLARAAPVLLHADFETLVEKGEFAQPVGDSLEIELKGFENLRVRFEVGDRTGLPGRATCLQLRCRDSPFVALAMDLPFLPYLDHHPLRQGVDHGSSDTVQTSRHLVGFLVELSPCVQHRHHYLDAGLVFDRMHTDWNPVAVVLNHDAAVDPQRDFDAGTAPCHRLVDTVVDDLLDQLVQAVLPCITDVHRRPLAHPLEPL